MKIVKGENAGVEMSNGEVPLSPEDEKKSL